MIVMDAVVVITHVNQTLGRTVPSNIVFAHVIPPVQTDGNVVTGIPQVLVSCSKAKTSQVGVGVLNIEEVSLKR